MPRSQPSEDGEVPVRWLQEFAAEADLSDEEYEEFVKVLGTDDRERTHKPASIREFVESRQFLDAKSIIWPEVMTALEELFDPGSPYTEAVLTGGIGTAKTTIALYGIAYGVYCLSVMHRPHEHFGSALDPTTEIVFVLQNLSATLAKQVDYARFRAMIEKSYYFRNHFPNDRNIESEMRFPKRIVVRPISGEHTAALGSNVIGGIIDEVNFMEIIEKSKRSMDGGTYNQAVENYQTIARRRESRFMDQGKLYGMLFLVSSKRYPGQFTDRKEDEAKRNPHIYVYNRRIWEVKPRGAYSEETFRVFVGDTTRQARFVAPEEVVDDDDAHLLVDVPIDFRHSFEEDMMASVRDICGMPTRSRWPFIFNVERMNVCFGRVPSILDREECDFVDRVVRMYRGRLRDLDKPRHVHLDLALTSDSAGVACGYVSRFIEVPRGSVDVEVLPVIHFDFILEVRPPIGGEIEMENIRVLLYRLKAKGLPILWVTADQYQSADTIQILRHHEFITGVRSVDVSALPYDVTKQALMDGRLMLPTHAKALHEFAHLERDPAKDKVDHPPMGSKDCADAVAGVVYELTTHAAIWVEHGVATSMPISVQTPGRRIQDVEEVKVW